VRRLLEDPDSAVYVADVEEESDAASWGAYPGPIRAVAVNGGYYKITCFEDFWEAVKELEAGEPIELFYVRYLEIRGLSLLAYEHYDERHIPERCRRPYDEDGIGSGTWEDRPCHNKLTGNG